MTHRVPILSVGLRRLYSAAAVALALLNDSLGGWGLPALVAGAAIAIPTLKYRRYWHGGWFWATMLGMAAIQIPLLLLVRPLMDQLKFAFNIAFGTVDVFLVALAVNWIRPKEEDAG